VDAALRDALGAELGSRVRDASPVRGGDVDRAWRVSLDDGRTVFAKTSKASADPTRYGAEAHGLRWLAEGPLRVPRVLASDARFLALEWIDLGAPAEGSTEALGRGLAKLHAMGAPSFGLERGNFLGTIAQDNTPEDDWPAFYGRRRLEPLLRRATALPAATRRRVERVIADLPALCGSPEPPARLHGDLWAGNTIWDATGAPVLVDPAAYGGHREIDLAMMRLFGGFDREVFAAYEDESPLAPGWEGRVYLYQLLPLLAHVVLFGASWSSSVEGALDRIE
jgi:fructosamine-3-kinase